MMDEKGMEQVLLKALAGVFVFWSSEVVFPNFLNRKFSPNKLR